jgi:hypothetical protein
VNSLCILQSFDEVMEKMLASADSKAAEKMEKLKKVESKIVAMTKKKLRIIMLKQQLDLDMDYNTIQKDALTILESLQPLGVEIIKQVV